MLQTMVKTTSYEKVTRHNCILFRISESLLANIVVVTVRYYTSKRKKKKKKFFRWYISKISGMFLRSLPKVRVKTACTARQAPTPATLAWVAGCESPLGTSDAFEASPKVRCGLWVTHWLWQKSLETRQTAGSQMLVTGSNIMDPVLCSNVLEVS